MFPLTATGDACVVVTTTGPSPAAQPPDDDRRREADDDVGETHSLPATGKGERFVGFIHRFRVRRAHRCASLAARQPATCQGQITKTEGLSLGAFPMVFFECRLGENTANLRESLWLRRAFMPQNERHAQSSVTSQ